MWTWFKKLLYQVTLEIQWFELPPDSYEQIATANGEKVGKTNGHIAPGGEFRIVNIEVTVENRNKLYGSRMIDQLIEEAKSKSCNTLVFQGVSDKNVDVIRLYKRLGAMVMQNSSTQIKSDYKISI